MRYLLVSIALAIALTGSALAVVEEFQPGSRANADQAQAMIASSTPLPPPSPRVAEWRQSFPKPLASTNINGRIIRVPEDYATIAEAMAVANAGDTVLVAPGTFCGNVTVKVGVSLIGSGSSQTFVEGCSGGTVLYMDPDSVVSNLTVWKSGIGHWDAGIWVWQGTVTIERSAVISNGMGIVLYCSASSCAGRPKLMNNVIAYNRNTGLRISPYHSADVINNTLVGNNDGVTGDTGSAALLLNNIIAGHPWAGIWNMQGEPGTGYNDFWNNGTDYRDAEPLVGSLYFDPMFTNAAAGDFHLDGRSLAVDAGSNTGAPPSDIDGDPRPLDGDGDGTATVDIGADEYAGLPLTRTPTPTPTPTPRPAVTTPVVFVISFTGYGTPRDDVNLLTTELIDLLKRATMYHGYTNPSVQPYIEYQVYGGSVIEDLVLPPVLPNGMSDYGAIYDRYGLCSLIAGGVVDEVWVWVGGGNGIDKGHFGEWVTTGPGWPGGFSPSPEMVNAPDCGKIVTTMAFNYAREVDVALESLNHRLEGFFMTYFPCDFYTETWPWQGAPAQCAGLVSDRYGFVARPFAGNDYIGGCGDAHCPPNILHERPYVYDDLTIVQTICPDWSQDGSAQVTTLDCLAWGCTHWGYHVWWMQNVPGLNNTNRDRNGNLHTNWWSYIFGAPHTPAPTATPTPTSTQTATPTSTPIPTTTPTPAATTFVSYLPVIFRESGGVR